jgi:hypothetical protein
MTREFEELQRLITESRDHAKAERKKCWYAGTEDKAHYDGQIVAYGYVLAMIKNVNNL